jgi:hypothetical protein
LLQILYRESESRYGDPSLDERRLKRPTESGCIRSAGEPKGSKAGVQETFRSGGRAGARPLSKGSKPVRVLQAGVFPNSLNNRPVFSPVLGVMVEDDKVRLFRAIRLAAAKSDK